MTSLLPTPRLAVLSCVSFTLVLLANVLSNVNLSAQDSPHKQVLCLHTERFPYTTGHKIFKKDQNTTIFSRELTRQAFAIAAAEELRVSVRDQTIGESWPVASDSEGIEVIHVVPLLRSNWNKQWQVRLYVVDPANLNIEKLWAQKPLWKKTYEYEAAAWNHYKRSSIAMEQASRTDFVDALKLAGVKPNVPVEPSTPKRFKTLSKKWDRSLEKVDFVSQFDVARSAHQTMEQHGASNESVGYLIRAYGNLSLLTNHFFSAATDAYAARAILYSRRILASSSDDEAKTLAHWHLLYAQTMAGLQHNAQALSQTLHESHEAPRWAEFIRPCLDWDSESLLNLAGSKSPSADWARLMWFQQVDAYGYANPTYLAAEETMDHIPSAFGVYTDVAKRIYSDEHRHLSGPKGTSAFNQRLPKSLMKVSGMPKLVTRILKEKNLYDLQNMGMVIVQGYNGEFTGKPKLICETLRTISTDTREEIRYRSRSLSWSALAFLVEEQQFNTMYEEFNFLCGQSGDDLSKALSAMVKFLGKHRYIPLLRSLFYHRREDREKYDQLIATMRIRDIRWHHHHLLRNLKNSPDSSGKDIRHSIVEYASMNYTARGYIERINTIGPEWDVTRAWNPLGFAKQVSFAMPGSELGNRMTIRANKKNATPEQLAAWEAKIDRDPASWSHLGMTYAERGDHNEALRCYLAGNELLPRHNDSRRMASAYFSVGNYEEWQSELEYALSSSKNVRLSHARLQVSLALGLSIQGKFREAKPFALQAAQTRAGWALLDAGKILESLAQWDESEAMLERLSKMYPSTREQWYFWCRRTGRGNVADAKAQAEKSLTDGRGYPYRTRGILALLDDDPDRAQAALSKAISHRFYPVDGLLVIQIAGQTDDLEMRAEAISKYEAAIEILVKRGEANSGYSLFLELLKTDRDEPIEDMMSFKIDQAIRSFRTATGGATMCYFVGEEMRQRGELELAKTYFRRSLIGPEIHTQFSTLAGNRLCQMSESGKSRPDNDELDLDTMWPPFEPNGQ